MRRRRWVMWNNNLFCNFTQTQTLQHCIWINSKAAVNYITAKFFIHEFISSRKKVLSTLQFYDRKPVSIWIEDLFCYDKEFEEFIESFKLKHAVMSCQVSR